jgi:hypothetical protein
MQQLCRTVGLHPLVGFGMVAVDWMMFGGTVSTGGVGWCVTMPVALFLSIPSALLQRHAFGDGWGIAIAKGMIVGVLTAIPTPLPSIAPLAGGVLGVAKQRLLPEAKGT